MRTLRMFLLYFIIVVNISPPLNAMPDPDIQIDVVQKAQGCASGRCDEMENKLSTTLNNIDEMISNIELELQSLKGAVETKFDNIEQNLQSFQENMKNDSSLFLSEIQSLTANMDLDIQSLEKNLNTSLSDVNSEIGKLGCPEGLFQLSGQCFKYVRKGANYQASKSACEAEGLVLAKPYDPLALQSYLAMRYGPSMPIWIGARGISNILIDDTHFEWNIDNITLGAMNPMWQTGYPKEQETEDHFLMMDLTFGKKPYFPGYKSSSNFYSLCEFMRE